MERSRSRAERGKRAFSRRPRNHGQKYTIIGAISIHGVVCFKIIKGSMKGKDFEKFTVGDLCPRLDATKVVGMDNLNWHKRKEIIETIEKTGARGILLTSI
jgi:transposase